MCRCLFWKILNIDSLQSYLVHGCVCAWYQLSLGTVSSLFVFRSWSKDTHVEEEKEEQEIMQLLQDDNTGDTDDDAWIVQDDPLPLNEEVSLLMDGPSETDETLSFLRVFLLNEKNDAAYDDPRAVSRNILKAMKRKLHKPFHLSNDLIRLRTCEFIPPFLNEFSTNKE